MEAAPKRLTIRSTARFGTIAAQVQAAGWAVDTRAPVAIVDLADATPRDANGAGTTIAIATQAGSAAAWQAYAAGATYWLAPEYKAEDLAAVLAFAARHVEQRGGAAERRVARSEDAALEQWFEAHGPQPASAIVIAMTRFEFVNAAYGRATGDALMAAAAERIGAWTREALGENAIIRRDGTEFAVLASGAIEAEAAAALDRALARPFDVAGAAPSLGSRIGMAAEVAGEGLATLLARARRALGHSNPAGGNERLDALAADLHLGIERGEVVIRFQPQVVVATGAIAGVEALARWDHPVHGPLGADDLFAAADRADLGNALSEHIQRRALEEAARWPAALSRLRLAINVTAADLARPGFADAFLARIAASGVARGRVSVEIVETGLMDDLDGAAAILARLRGAGCRIAIDDFGTGYSSLAYLKALPIDYLKIDRSLTRDIAGSDRDRAIVRGVIAIARSLGLWTIAEGVEAESERALLEAEGCDLYQGFLCSEPVDSAGLAALAG